MSTNNKKVFQAVQYPSLPANCDTVELLTKRLDAAKARGDQNSQEAIEAKIAAATGAKPALAK